MIVIINSIEGPFFREVACCLGALMDNCRVVESNRISESFLKTNFNKNDKNQKCIVAGTFERPEALRKLRLRLDQADNEIYAFRLPLAPIEIFKEYRASGIYTAWKKNQEEGSLTGDMGYEILISAPSPLDTAQKIFNDIHAPVEIVPYQSDWPENFGKEKEDIAKALKGNAILVEHMGSTAIPGMPAKPIIDILVTVETFAKAYDCIAPLTRMGYAFIDYPQNKDRLFFRKGNPRSRHIHIVQHESRSHAEHIAFRDALLAYEDLREEYLRLKIDSREKYKFRRALYGEKKWKIIQKALKRASLPSS